MYFGYYDYFSEPQPEVISSSNFLIIAAAIGAVIGVILYFTLFRKSNEKKLKGGSLKIFNFMNLNKFYLEDIIRLLNILTFFVVTAEGVALLINGEWEKGLLVLFGLNLAARIVYEILMMFVIQVRRTITIDKKLNKIEKFYEDEFEDFDDGECGPCEGCSASSCEGCSGAPEEAEEVVMDKNKESDFVEPPHVIEL